MSWVPPEVKLDENGGQILATTKSGKSYQRYELCARGCGYLIGCGDAHETVWHASCGERVAPAPPTDMLVPVELLVDIDSVCSLVAFRYPRDIPPDEVERLKRVSYAARKLYKSVGVK